MTPPYRCRQCLYFYYDYIFHYREGNNWCNHWRKEVDPEKHACNDFVLPTVVYEENVPCVVDECRKSS